MAFDVDGALKAGYSQSEIADHLAGQSDFNAAGARQAGYSDDEIIRQLSQPAPTPRSGDTSESSALSDLPEPMQAPTVAEPAPSRSRDPSAPLPEFKAMPDVAPTWRDRIHDAVASVTGSPTAEQERKNVQGARASNAVAMGAGREDGPGYDEASESARRAVGGVSQIPQAFAEGALQAGSLGVIRPTIPAELHSGAAGVAKGVGELAGFIGGAPMALTTKLAEASGFAAFMTPGASASFGKALLTDAASQAATLGVASGLQQSGSAVLDEHSAVEGLKSVGEAIKGGVITGGLFGVGGRLLPGSTNGQWMGRALGVGLAQDVIHGTRPWDDRPAEQKAYDYLQTIFFTRHGAGTAASGAKEAASAKDAAPPTDGTSPIPALAPPESGTVLRDTPPGAPGGTTAQLASILGVDPGAPRANVTLAGRPIESYGADQLQSIADSPMVTAEVKAKAATELARRAAETPAEPAPVAPIDPNTLTPTDPAPTPGERPPAETSTPAEPAADTAASTRKAAIDEVTQEQQDRQGAGVTDAGRAVAGDAAATVSNLETQRARNAAELESGNRRLADVSGGSEETPHLGPIADDAVFAASQHLADAVHAVSGVRPVMFHDPRSNAPDGFALDGQSYVNAANLQQSLHSTVFHETFHVAEQRAASGDTSAQQFVKSAYAIFDIIPVAAKERYAREYLFRNELGDKKGKTPAMTIEDALNHPALKSEMIADFFGKRGQDPAFLKNLARRDKAGFGGFARTWIDSLSNMLAEFKAKRSAGVKDIDPFITNLANAKAVATSALIEWRKTNPLLAASVPAAGGTRTAVPKRLERAPDSVLPPEVLKKAQEFSAADHPAPADQLTAEGRAKAGAMLAPKIEAAAAAKPDFDRRLTNIAEQLGGDTKLTGIKGEERAATRLGNDHGGSADNVRDLLRGSVVVPTIHDVPDALRAISRNFDIEPGRIKDRFTDSPETGYQDVAVNVITANGTKAEIQIHLPETMAVKDLAHAIYNTEREMPPGAAKEGLVNLQRQINGEAAKTSAPVAESLKVFSTRKAAEAARDGLGNTHKLRAVDGGFILRAKSDAEVRAGQAAGQRLRRKAAPDVDKDSLLPAIAKLGGLSMAERADTIHEGNRNVGGKMLFTKEGRPLDLMAHALSEDGYIPHGEMERDGGVSWLHAAIGDEFGGHQTHYSQNGEAWMRARQRDAMGDGADHAAHGADAAHEPLERYSTADLDAAGYTHADTETQALAERMAAEYDAIGLRAEAPATEGRTDADHHAEINRDVQEAVAQARADAARRDTEATRGRDADHSEAAGDQGQEGLTLEAQTEQGLRDKAAREKAGTDAERAKKAAEQTALSKAAEARENKARADASVDDFQLGQSADEQMSGQAPMFSRNAEHPIQAAVDKADLSAQEHGALSKRYGTRDAAEFLTRLAQDVADYTSGVLKDATAVARRAIRRVAVAALSGAIILNSAFNPHLLKSAEAHGIEPVKTVVTTEIKFRQPKVAELHARVLSLESKRVADWVATTAGKSEVSLIIDKPNAHMWVMKGGEVIADTPVLTGKTKGDILTERARNAKSDDITESEKVTPAGVFPLTKQEPSTYGSQLNFLSSEQSPYAIHRVYLGDPTERRTQRLASPNADDHMISYGCVNVSSKFYDNQLAKQDYTGNAFAYILPHDVSRSAEFVPTPDATLTTKVTRTVDEPQSARSPSEGGSQSGHIEEGILRDRKSAQRAGSKRRDDGAPPAEDSNAPMFSRKLEDGTAYDGGHERSETARIPAASRLTKLVERRRAEKISELEFAAEVANLAGELSQVRDTKASNRLYATRERGADMVRERLIRAMRQGDIERETGEFALWALGKNPSLATGLGISIREAAKHEGGIAGKYNPADLVMTLIKGSANTGTAVHEILHHTERMMPAEIQSQIRREWAKHLAREVGLADKANNTRRIEALRDMIAASEGSSAAQRVLVRHFNDGWLKYDRDYQLVNPSEFWAVNATRILARRYGAESWIDKARAWMGEMVQKAQGLLGLRSDAPVLHGLAQVMGGDGVRQSKEMLATRASALNDTRDDPQTKTPEFKAWYGDWQNDAKGASDETASDTARGYDGDGGDRNVDAVQRRGVVGEGDRGSNRVGDITFPGASGPLGKSGRPAVFFHGTRDDPTAFDLNHPNRKDRGWLGRGVYGASDSEIANSYARLKSGAGDPNVMPLFMAVRNPHVATLETKARLKNASQAEIDRFTEALKSQGHDGVALALSNGTTELMAFEPTQIKSAIGNNGDFDPKNPDIRRSAKWEGEEDVDSLDAAPPIPTSAQRPLAGAPAAVKSKMAQLGASFLETAKTVGSDMLMKVSPMSLGSDSARAIAKDYADAERLSRYQWAKFDAKLAKDFDETQRRDMWNAADEENDILSRGLTPGPKEGLNQLSDEQRATMDLMHNYGETLLQRARDVGMFEGESLPYWAPRMAVIVGENGEISRPRIEVEADAPVPGGANSSGDGANISLSAPSLKTRRFQTAREYEAAMKLKNGKEATLVRDIRTMPMALARIESAIAARELINNIKELGERTGRETVSPGEKPDFFTIDHPAFKTFSPRLEKKLDGSFAVKLDDKGEPFMDSVPIYIAKDFEGPLRAIMSQKSGAIYSGLMSLKAKTMGLIMYSPLIHNAVEWGRAMPVMPGKVLTFQIYFAGNKIKNDPTQMRQAITDGLVPIGGLSGNPDITSLLVPPGMDVGRSLTAKALAFPVGLVSKPGALRVKKGVDAAGNFWHNTLLWDRIGDLQAGLYGGLKADLVKKGMDEGMAGKLAAHWANRFAGALPNEAMSANARKIINIVAFSRTFTLGNLGAMKDVFTGLPKDVKSQLMRDYGELSMRAGVSVARRKAFGALVVDIGLMYAANSIFQDVLDKMKGRKSWGQIGQGYLDRISALAHRAKETPWDVMNSPLVSLESLFSTSENEPGREGRVFVGRQADGTAIYGRVPMGKVGEDMKGWATAPLATLKAKLSPFVKPLVQTFNNDNGIGQRIYDPDAKGMSGAAETAGRIALNIMKQQVPADAVQGAVDWAHGDASESDKFKAIGPLAGVTFSKGAPGGPAVGEIYAEQRRQHGMLMDQMPKINRALKLGANDPEQWNKALDMMRDLKMSPSQMKTIIEHQTAPESRLTPAAVKKFAKTASDESKDKLSNAMGR